MSKHSASNQRGTTQAISFIEFWRCVALELGDSRLSVNPCADRLSNLVDPTSDPKAYLSSVIEQSYKRSNCKRLDDSINLEYVLDVLGETAFELQGKQADDLLDIELLEEIAWVISERFKAQLDLSETGESVLDHGNNRKPDHQIHKPAQVVSLLTAKTIKSNSQF